MTRNIKNVVHSMDQMYLNRNEMGDVTFLVDSQRIRAHRIVLATQSPKYKAQFYGPNPDGDEIYVPNVSADAFNVFLQFFYKKTIDLTMDNIESVMDLAQQSLVDEFIETCVKFLKKQIRITNKLCVPYRLAKLYGIETLRLSCEYEISVNTLRVFASDDFLRCDRDMFLHILKVDTFNCKEIDVFHACIARARVQCKRIHLDPKPENLRTVLGDAIYEIRFSSFNAAEFADLHRSMDGFFTADEVVEILYMIGNLKDFKPQKFNQLPRLLQNDPPKAGCSNAFLLKALAGPWSLEFDRFLRKRRAMAIDVSGIFKFSFSCSHPIRLHGIGLCIYFNAYELKGFAETISVGYIGDNAWGDDLEAQTAPMKYKAYTSPTRNNETLIVFEKPIERVREFTCSIQLPFKLLNYEFDLRHTIQAENMVFTLKDGKWMKRIFCDKYTA